MIWIWLGIYGLCYIYEAETVPSPRVQNEVINFR